MNLLDLAKDFKEQKRPPEELAGDFAEAIVKATYQEMSQFRYLLVMQSPKTKDADNKYQAYTTMVVLYATKNPQYVKKVQEYSATLEVKKPDPLSKVMKEE